MGMMIPPVGAAMFIVGVLMVIAGFGSSNARKTAKALATQMETMRPAAPVPAEHDRDDEKWAALTKYDDEIRAAVEELQPLGPVAIRKLRSAYLALNDKTKLPAIVRDIQESFGK
jgi:hypothetical protein